MWWCWRGARPAGLRPDRRRITNIRLVPQDYDQAFRHSEVCPADVRGTAPSAASASAERPARTPARCAVDANCRGRAGRLRSLRAELDYEPPTLWSSTWSAKRHGLWWLHCRAMCARCAECTAGVPVHARGVDSAVLPGTAARSPPSCRIDVPGSGHKPQPSGGDDACRSCVAALEWCGAQQQPKRQSASIDFCLQPNDGTPAHRPCCTCLPLALHRLLLFESCL